MSRPPLESTPIGTTTTYIETSHLGLTPIDKKTPDPKPLTLPTYLSKLRGNGRVSEDPDTDQSLSSSSSSESDSSDEINHSKYKNKGRDTKKNHKNTHETGLVIIIVKRLLFVRQSDYICNKRRNKKSPINLCAKLTTKLLMTAYK